MARSIIQLLFSILYFDLDALFNSLRLQIDKLDPVIGGCEQHVALGVELKCVHWRTQVQVEHLGALGVVVLHLPDRDLAVLAAQRHARPVGRDGTAVQCADVLSEHNLLLGLVQIKSARRPIPRGGEEVQHLVFVHWEELDTCDPVRVLGVEFVLQLAVQVPVDDAVVPADRQDVLLGRADGDVQHVGGVCFEQFGFDVRDQVEFAVFGVGVDCAQFDGAHLGVPAGGECEASVVGECQILDEVAVFCLSFVYFSLVSVLVGIHYADCFIS